MTDMATKQSEPLTSEPDKPSIYAVRDGQGDTFISPDEMATLTGGAIDESDLSERRKKLYGILDDNGSEISWPVWVANPNDMRNRDRGDEVQKVMDRYPGSKLAINPETGEEVRNEDMCLVLRPIKYKAFMDDLNQKQALAYLANNPSTAAGLGLSDDSIRELRYKFCDPEALKSRDEQFSREDKERYQAIAKTKRQTWQRALKSGSPTYGLPLNLAYETQLQRFAMDRGLSRRQAESAFRDHLTEVMAQARRGGRSDGGITEWGNTVKRWREQSTSSRFGGFNVTFGAESRQLQHSRKLDNQRQQGQRPKS